MNISSVLSVFRHRVAVQTLESASFECHDTRCIPTPISTMACFLSPLFLSKQQRTMTWKVLLLLLPIPCNSLLIFSLCTFLHLSLLFQSFHELTMTFATVSTIHTTVLAPIPSHPFSLNHIV